MDIVIVKERIFATHGDTVKIVEDTFVGFKKHATFIDIDFGEWNALVYAVCRGQRHPERFRSAVRTTLEEAKRRLFDAHGNEITIKEDTWESGSKLCTFIDKDYGEWSAYLCNVVNGIGHPQRLSARRSEFQTFSLNQVQKMLDEKHDGSVILVGPYVNMCTPCTFKDVEFGEFVALPLNVVRGTGHIKRAGQRRRKTSIERFGVPHHMQNDEQFIKHLRSQRKHLKCLHWKTNIELDCMNRWELATVQWFNERKIDFIWQPKAFKMPCGHTYRPDAYIVDWNLWIDIKGYYPEGSRRKCEWFKTIMPNFELWFEPKLRELGIL